MQSKLPELTKDEILHSHPIVSNNKGSDLYVTLEAARLSMDKYADQWRVKYDELKKSFDTLKGEIVQVEKAGSSLLFENQQLKERCDKMEDALEKIKATHKKYHDLNGDNPAANHLMNIALEALAHKPEGINENQPPDPCPHCGKGLSRDRNLCCRECGKEVVREACTCDNIQLAAHGECWGCPGRDKKIN